MGHKGRCAALAAALMILFSSAALGQGAIVDNGKPGGKLNMREEPKKDAAMIGQFYTGTQVEIIAEVDGWSKVRLGTGRGVIEGYMMTQFLTDWDSNADETYDVSVVSPYGTPSVVLRDRPSNSYDAVAMLQVGELVRVIGVSGEYVIVCAKNGSVGCLALSETK